MLRADNAAKELMELHGLTRPEGGLRLLPDPEPRPIWCPIISADDHLLEPPDLFVDRLPRRFEDAAPRVETNSDGLPVWIVDGQEAYVTGGNAAAGRPMEEWSQLVVKHEEMRPGVWDIAHRVRDMDLIGVWASLCFPATTFGFTGKRFSAMDDRDLGLACVRAYNDWVIEEWCGPYPERFIPCQIPWLPDPEVAAEEIHRNAARGFTCVSFTENPEGLGYPGLYSGHWDPFLRACEETETVVNLHVGSSGMVQRPSSESPHPVVTALFPLNGIIALVDWVYAKIPIRFPGIRIALSEAGATWVPMVKERLDRIHRQRSMTSYWRDDDPHPVDLVQRNFWFTSIEDPSAFHNLDTIGTDRVMVESDYPHFDSTWPDTQQLLERDLRHLPAEDIRRICYGNAAELYRHGEPPTEWLDSSAIGRAEETGHPTGPTP